MEFPSMFFRPTVLLLLPLVLNPAMPTGTSSDRESAMNSAPARFDGPAELPRISMNSSLADSPAHGKTWKLKPGDDFQEALNRASCGETITLAAGATFTGDFSLPAKSCDNSNWIIIRSSAPDSSLPAEGTRITPCYAGVASLPGRPALNCTSTQKVMATLMANNDGGPIKLAEGAHH